MKKIAILGATGSVGGSVISVLDDHADKFEVTGLAAGRASEELIALAAKFPHAMIAVAAVPDASFRQRLEAVGGRGGIFTGDNAAAEMTFRVDAEMCVAAVSGTAGLAGAFVAAERGMTVLLANKEVLVSAGELFMSLAEKSGATVLPLDSEHAALWQCLEGRDQSQLEKITITASGGPFRLWSAADMARATPQDALKHPVWSMGAKISIDSATLANKALEVIEARGLYRFDNIDVLVHPQSTVHGMVEWRDGSVIAHMGACDMRQPIGYMLFYPEPAEWRRERVDLARIGALEFFAPDFVKFPLLRMGLEAGKKGGWWPAYFNIANEEAVGMFLREEIGFADMAGVVADVLTGVPGGAPRELGEVIEAHGKARELARRRLRMTGA